MLTVKSNVQRPNSKVQSAPSYVGNDSCWPSLKNKFLVTVRLSPDWRGMELGLRRKGDIAKLRMAKVLRAKTTMGLAWIAERLQMGVHGHLSHLLYWQGKEKPDNKRKVRK
jgi:hypothetical protein